jgi:hypothetical protein
MLVRWLLDKWDDYRWNRLFRKYPEVLERLADEVLKDFAEGRTEELRAENLHVE